MNIYALVGCIVAGILVVMIVAWMLARNLINFKHEKEVKLTNGRAAFILNDLMPEIEKTIVNVTKRTVEESFSVMKKTDGRHVCMFKEEDR